VLILDAVLEDPKASFSAVAAHHTSRASDGQLLNGARVWRRGLTTGQKSGPARGQGMIAGHGDQRARE
jgi:hypothetical protein